MIAADRIAPAIATPALVGAGTANAERILCVISILHVSFRSQSASQSANSNRILLLYWPSRIRRFRAVPIRAVPTG
jgi:hypothetical protein